MPEHTYHISEDGHVDPNDLLPYTRDTLERYNDAYKKDRAEYFDRLENAGRYLWSGVQHVHMRDRGDSTRECVLFHSPWATPVAPGNTAEDITHFVENLEMERPKDLDTNRWSRLIMADFLHVVLKEAGVTDDNGDHLPVLMMPSPSLDRRGIGGDWNRATLRKPMIKLRALGQTALEMTEMRGYGELNLGGVSQGSSIVSEIVKSGYGSHFDIRSTYYSEMPSHKNRNTPDFARRYFTDSSTDWQFAGPLPREEIARGSERYNWKNVYGNGNFGLNLRLGLEMSKERFKQAFDASIMQRIPVTVEYGDKSKVSEGIDKVLDQDGSAMMLEGVGLLQRIRATGFAPHSHTENLILTTDGLVRSVLFGKHSLTKDRG